MSVRDINNFFQQSFAKTGRRQAEIEKIIRDEYDIIVAGAGNAALSAAIAARDAGASVLVLEKAPMAFSLARLGSASIICAALSCFTTPATSAPVS